MYAQWKKDQSQPCQSGNPSIDVQDGQPDTEILILYAPNKGSGCVWRPDDAQMLSPSAQESLKMTLVLTNEGEDAVLDSKTKVLVSNNPIHLVYASKQLVDQEHALNILISVMPNEEEMAEDRFLEYVQLIYNEAYDIKLYRMHQELYSNLTTKKSGEMSSGVIETITEYLQGIPREKDVQVWKSGLIPEIFNHGFTSRHGGCSTHPGAASLNLTRSIQTRDGDILVLENRRRLAEHCRYNPEKFHLAKAIHGKEVWNLDEEEPSSYDGVSSNIAGEVAAAPGADCVILLFADPVSRSFAAVHSGWKGTLAGIPQETIRNMTKHYGANPADIIVVMGPSLNVCCFEVGEEVAEPFAEIDPSVVCQKPEWKKRHVDQRSAIRILLERSGVPAANIDDSSVKICTKCNPDKVFSFRYSGKPFGNQVGFIGLKE